MTEAKKSKPEEVEVRVETKGDQDHEYVVYGVSGGKGLQAGRNAMVKSGRDMGTELITSVGILALAAFESADIVGRAAGNLFFKGLRDTVKAGATLSNEVSHAVQEATLKNTRGALNTAVEVGAEFVRAAKSFNEQGRELSQIGEDFGRTLTGSIRGVIASAPKAAERKETAVVPISIK